jgi:arylsulfatase A-like enzyme
MKWDTPPERYVLRTIRCVIAVLLAPCFAFAEAPDTKPNVLFIMIDDLRPELGCYGAAQAKTPNIDRLAAQGLLFERAYCQVPVCGASRASLMTGILPTESRFVNYFSRSDEDVPGAATLPQVFKNAGYTTLSNGKIFHNKKDSDDRSWSEPAWRPSNLPFLTGFDPETTSEIAESGRGRIYEYPEVSDDAYGDGKVAQKTIEDLRRLKTSNEPFFLACGFVRPHMPFYAPKRYWDLYDREDIAIARNRSRPTNAPQSLRGSGEYKQYTHGSYEEGTDEWHRMMRHGYYASTSYVDKLTGNVLNELDRLGLAENTIVVLWGDHGWHLGEHDFWGKHNTLHNALRVPLIIKGPGITTGKNTAALVESVDIFPTLCTLAGLPIPSSVQGRSFDPLLNHPDQKFRGFIYTRFKTADAVVTNQFVYTRYQNNEQMLFDLQNDPLENLNVASDPGHTEIVIDMERMLRIRMQEAIEID